MGGCGGWEGVEDVAEGDTTGLHLAQHRTTYSLYPTDSHLKQVRIYSRNLYGPTLTYFCQTLHGDIPEGCHV